LPTGVGGSVVVSPFGEVVAYAGADPERVIADIDIDKVAAARESGRSAQ
jgi:predicted amidohydrolase